MKSINEKAKEVQIGYDDIQAPAIGTGFVAGANYVLDVVEEFMKHNLVHSSNMKRLIEQLKK